MLSRGNITATEAEGFTEPVDLASVKKWLVIDYDTDDTLLQGMITAAREDIEQETGLALVAKDVVYSFSVSEWDAVQLPYALKVEEVTLTDAEEQEVDTDNYRHRGGYLHMKATGAYTVTYTTPTTIPTSLKEAIKMLVAYRYNNRGDQDKQQGLPEDIKSKVSKYAQIWL